MAQPRNSLLLGHYTHRKTLFLEWLVYAQRNMARVRLGWPTSYESPRVSLLACSILSYWQSYRMWVEPPQNEIFFLYKLLHRMKLL